MARLGIKLGANPLTFAGLSGMGDLIATCTSDLSRNRRAGIELARGTPVSAITGSQKMVVEGAHTVSGAYKLGQEVGVELPIVEEVLAVIEGAQSATGNSSHPYAERSSGRAELPWRKVL